MSEAINVTGNKYNMLLVVSQFSNGRRTVCRCICDCGNETEVTLDKLKSGHTRSCGCLAHKSCRDKTYIRLWNIYTKIKRRCYVPKEPAYKYYGKRGISMCDEWKNTPTSFFEWAKENGYQDDLTIDRIDVNGNYEPDNCRWATRKEQALNRRSNVILEHNGERKTLGEWAEEYNINRSTLLHRLDKKWSIEKALTSPIDTKRRNHNAVKISKGV